MPQNMIRDYWSKKYLEEELNNRYFYKEKKPAENTLDMAQKVFGEFSGMKILDFGAGYGRNAFPIAEKGAQIFALDIAPAAIKMMSTINKEKKLDITKKLINAEFEKLDFADNFFDGIFLFSVLEHLCGNTAISYLKEFKRVLNEKGFLIATFSPENEEDVDLTGAIHRKDGSWMFESGKKAGLIWRPYKDSEIKFLFKDFNIVKFLTTASGVRKIFVENH